MQLTIGVAILLCVTSQLLLSEIKVSGENLASDNAIHATFDSLRDRYRPLLVFAPSEKDPRFCTQIQSFSRGLLPLRDRQVVFVPLTYRKVVKRSGVVPDSDQVKKFQQVEGLKLRHSFHIKPEDFTVVLIGKDGGEKFRSHNPVTIERLNALIDAMPMRQQEVHDGNSK